MSVINQNLLLTPEGYQISRSVRLRSSASAYFNRTPSVTTSTTKFTWSGWVKRGQLGINGYLLLADNGTYYNFLKFNTSDQLETGFSLAGGSYGVKTSAVFRDPSSWYHIIYSVDTTQATSTNREQLYVNGVLQVIGSTQTNGYVPQNTASYCNTSGVAMQIGSFTRVSNYFDGYLTEVNFIDGQSLTPSSFGETNPVTGVWQPKKYAGTYGTKGFYLNFSDPSAATAAAIGKDYSGNGNNWTPNNISVTAGVTYDSMIDVPTMYADGGNGRGNYAVVNPLSKGTSQTNVIDGNLYAVPVSGASNWGTVFSSIAIPTSGKWYVEALANVYTGSGNSSSLGVVDSSAFIPTNAAILYSYTTGQGFDGILAHLFSDYVSPIAHGVQGTNVTGKTASTILLMLGIDVDNGKIYVGADGTWLNSGNPAGGTGFVSSRTFSASDVVAGHTSWNGTNDQSQYYNFGQRPFVYTPPTGFKALNTQNLPDSTIKKGGSAMNTVLVTGTGSNQSITGYSFAPDLVWIKKRSAIEDHKLFDTVRGAINRLASNTTGAEVADNDLYGFTADGFDGSLDAAATYAAWGWKANGSSVSNTAGSITSQVSAGVSQGFSVVTYTGTGANATVGHGLGVAPKMVIVKRRDVSDNWEVYHASLTANGAVRLNLTSAYTAAINFWNNTAPTSTAFSVGNYNSVNASGGTHVAYCFAEVAGFSKFGSYTGNGSADGPFVYCGFRPRFILIKDTTVANNWILHDTARDTYNTTVLDLLPNSSAAEGNSSRNIDVLSNGFKIRAGTGLDINNSGSAFIFAAFAENPFKNALAR